MGEHRGQVVGYVRVSSADQNEARQLEALGVSRQTLYYAALSGTGKYAELQVAPK